MIPKEQASHCHNNGKYWVCPPLNVKHVSNTLKKGSINTDELPITFEHDSPTRQHIPRWQPLQRWHKIPPPPKEE